MVFATIVGGSRFLFKMFPSNFRRILGLGPGLIIFFHWAGKFGVKKQHFGDKPIDPIGSSSKNPHMNPLDRRQCSDIFGRFANNNSARCCYLSYIYRPFLTQGASLRQTSSAFGSSSLWCTLAMQYGQNSLKELLKHSMHILFDSCSSQLGCFSRRPAFSAAVRIELSKTSLSAIMSRYEQHIPRRPTAHEGDHGMPWYAMAMA